MPTVGAVKEYMKTRRPNVSAQVRRNVNKNNIFEMWQKHVQTAQPVAEDSDEDTLGPDPTGVEDFRLQKI